MSLVELKNVVKRYGQNTVLNGVSLAVDKGEIIAIIGRSGSGKSTLLRCVNGLEPIQGGTVAFDGTTVNDPATDLRKLRQHVGIVFQSFNLFPHLTVEKNITLAPKVVKGMAPAEARTLAQSVLAKVGLAEKMAREGMTMMLVTHEIGFARKVADRVVFMHEGLIWEEGPAAATLASPRTPELETFLSAVLH